MAAGKINRYHDHRSGTLDSDGIGNGHNDVLSWPSEAEHGPDALWGSPRDSPSGSRGRPAGAFPCLMQRELTVPDAPAVIGQIPPKLPESASHESQAVVFGPTSVRGRACRRTGGRMVGRVFQVRFGERQCEESQRSVREAEIRLRRGASNPIAGKRQNAGAL
jgi:hypothetical protein